MKFFLFVVLVSFFSIESHAQDLELQQHQTRVVVDNGNGQINFFINDELMAVLDADGLTVNGSVTAQSIVHQSPKDEIKDSKVSE